MFLNETISELLNSVETNHAVGFITPGELFDQLIVRVPLEARRRFESEDVQDNLNRASTLIPKTATVAFILGYYPVLLEGVTVNVYAFYIKTALGWFAVQKNLDGSVELHPKEYSNMDSILDTNTCDCKPIPLSSTDMLGVFGCNGVVSIPSLQEQAHQEANPLIENFLKLDLKIYDAYARLPSPTHL